MIQYKVSNKKREKRYYNNYALKKYDINIKYIWNKHRTK